jgi:hypothetical protein
MNLFEKHKSGDIRWTEKNYEIKEVLLRPRFPLMYTIDDDTTVHHTVVY